MKDIQFNTSVSKEEWEKLHHTYIHEWELAVAVQKALVKKGCYTIGDVIDMSDVELQKIIETIPTSYAELINPKRLENIKNILKERNITLPTEEEKQSILDSLSEEEQLKREIKILKYKNERLEEKNIIWRNE